MNPRRFKKKVGRVTPCAPRKQELPEAVLEDLLRFIQTKFYPADPVAFAKDRPRLLKWVIFKLATYLEKHGVTIFPAQYLVIMRDNILMEAVRHQRSIIGYVPAWLACVVETHLDHHGEEYYEQAKSVRNAVDNALAILHVAPVRARDVVREFAQASRLLKPKKAPLKASVKDQLNLL